MKILTVILLFNFLTLQGVDYYVSNLGNDTNTGNSELTAWKTISKVNSRTFVAGDRILFRCGDTWRETLNISSSGSISEYITFTSFGQGNKPKILGSNVSTWTSQGGNIWKSNSTFTNPYVSVPMAEVFFEQLAGSAIWGVHKTSISALTAEYNWTWSSNYVYIYSVSDPNSKYVSVEIPQRLYSISLNDKEYIIISGLDLKYSRYAGVDFQGTYPNLGKRGLIIRNCTISFIGSKITLDGFGIDAVYTDMIVEFCVIHDSGRRNISLNMYGNSNVSNITIQNNTLYNGSHTTGVDLSQSGSGIIDNVIIRNNLIYEDMNSTTPHSIMIFLQRYSGIVRNIYIYNNIFKFPIYSAIQPEGVSNVFIYNNVFYNFNASTSDALHIFVSAGSTNISIRNNIFYVDQNKNFSSIYTTVSPSQITSDYNIFYRINNTLRIINTGVSYYMNSVFPIASGWEKNSLKANPKFVSATNYHLQTGSPAIAKGIISPFVLTDFEGVLYGNTPNMGAYASVITDIEEIIVKVPFYPNPAKNQITLLGYVDYVQIYDFLGNILLQKNIDSENYSLPLNLKSGIYILIVNLKSYKLVIL
jgi:hypothetical protein